MKQSPERGTNRTGIMAAGRLAEEMIAATQEYPPSSPGSSLAIAEVRIAYVREGESFGEAPAPTALMDKAKAAVTAATGGQPTLLLDKLGERLAFERTGARLYETLLSKHRAYGTFTGGPTAEDVLHVLHEEYQHADMLEHAIKSLGGDPTALTPSANLAANVSAGLPQVLSDPRTNLLQSLEAIVVAELADNECWTALAQLSRQAAQEQLTQGCLEALAHERDHLRKVRLWIAAGQGRTAENDGAEMPETDDAEFSFTDDSPVDREGYVVSEEERAESREAGGVPQAGKSGKARSKRRSR
jgi:hypothetical protein